MYLYTWRDFEIVLKPYSLDRLLFFTRLNTRDMYIFFKNLFKRPFGSIQRMLFLAVAGVRGGMGSSVREAVYAGAVDDTA